MNDVRTGRKLKELRLGKNETLEEASNCCNISRSALSLYEAGRRVPRDSVKILLARHYGVRVRDIFFVETCHFK